jgi:Ser/Thr protein kinase RdoA (MazF antagonist)
VTAPDSATVDRLALLSGLGPVRELAQLPGGANNRVFRVQAECGAALLKVYFRHPEDTRDRLGAEFAFARFAWTAGLRCIPRPLACDPDAGLGLFEFLDGERPVEASGPLVDQAVEFVRGLNAERWRPAAARLPVASEACFSLAEHLGTVAARVDRLAALTPASDLDREAVRFARRELKPAWQQACERARAEARDNGLLLDRPLGLLDRCVSPSDFGFHNALVAPGGRVCFLDFEYAGWDDPAKLVCDYFCQPAVPVPWRFFDPFARALADCFPDPPFVARARLLLPVYRVKWVCIILNEFLPAPAGRRHFSTGEGLEARKLRQLARARAALAATRDRERSPA